MPLHGNLRKAGALAAGQKHPGVPLGPLYNQFTARFPATSQQAVGTLDSTKAKLPLLLSLVGHGPSAHVRSPGIALSGRDVMQQAPLTNCMARRCKHVDELTGSDHPGSC